ncbi:hypothetical protein FACS1894102_7850 [Spirochaetia bacterium]|nr:hypothetical protein FACS1894102_7850 [Spirochaetia bacterium]
MALMEDKPRSANATAYDDCSVLVIRKENFESLSVANPALVERLTKMLAERIWFGYRQLKNFCIKNAVGRMYDAIVMHMEQKHISMGYKDEGCLDFGPKELAKMCGIDDEVAKSVFVKMSNEKKITFTKSQIYSPNNEELVKLAEYYRGVQRREEARQA